MKLTCAHCGKRLSRKTARQIDGVVMCAPCMFDSSPSRQRSRMVRTATFAIGEGEPTEQS